MYLREEELEVRVEVEGGEQRDQAEEGEAEGEAEGDHGYTTLLQWFVDEQVEEEANSSKIVQDLRLVGNEGRGILMIDRELGTRTFVLAPDLTALYAMGAAAGA